MSTKTALEQLQAFVTEVENARETSETVLLRIVAPDSGHETQLSLQALRALVGFPLPAGAESWCDDPSPSGGQPCHYRHDHDYPHSNGEEDWPRA